MQAMHSQARFWVQRSDVDYIDKLAEEIASLIDAKRKPGQKVVLDGHSSGGGLTIQSAQ
ncbi:hypothetical protein ACFQ14_07995 [Pseudahrensia aquimaris]|uniref:Uncharacterized protein n=1 Tax=Pseudahrensia aquimaris TaxID=744461 RepID=A0ABW3FF45_9HYPH